MQMEGWGADWAGPRGGNLAESPHPHSVALCHLPVTRRHPAKTRQDNEPLMRALSSLIHVNAPNLVLFVGEALVGNDAVDQLVKFNRWGGGCCGLWGGGWGRRGREGGSVPSPRARSKSAL